MACNVPTSCYQVESAVLSAPLAKLWGSFKRLKLDALAPGIVKSSAFTSGGENQVGSVLKMEYADGASWEIRLTEISERATTVAYELISTDQSVGCTSMTGEIKLCPVTVNDQTFIQWSTEFSNDVSLERVMDTKYKKQEFFKAAQATLTA